MREEPGCSITQLPPRATARTEIRIVLPGAPSGVSEEMQAISLLGSVGLRRYSLAWGSSLASAWHGQTIYVACMHGSTIQPIKYIDHCPAKLRIPHLHKG